MVMVSPCPVTALSTQPWALQTVRMLSKPEQLGNVYKSGVGSFGELLDTDTEALQLLFVGNKESILY